jgi:orotate phosphoribosyltransferase
MGESQMRETEVVATVRGKGIPKSISSILAAWGNAGHINSILKAHPDYSHAKSGDALAALRLVRNLVPKEMLRETRTRWPGGTFLFGTAYLATEINQIPAALAWHLSQVAGGDVDFLTQQNFVRHTGASAAQRLLFRPAFQGNVCMNCSYVLVDDVVTMGTTLAEMANVVQKQGGVVAGVAVLINAARMEQLSPSQALLNQVRIKFGNELETLISIAPEALTCQEAEYLIGFRNAHTLRNRLARARNEQSAGLDARGRQKKSTTGARLSGDAISNLIDAVDKIEGDVDLEPDPLEDSGDAEPDEASII